MKKVLYSTSPVQTIDPPQEHVVKFSGDNFPYFTATKGELLLVIDCRELPSPPSLGELWRVKVTEHFHGVLLGEPIGPIASH